VLSEHVATLHDAGYVAEHKSTCAHTVGRRARESRPPEEWRAGKLTTSVRPLSHEHELLSGMERPALWGLEVVR